MYVGRSVYLLYWHSRKASLNEENHFRLFEHFSCIIVDMRNLCLNCVSVPFIKYSQLYQYATIIIRSFSLYYFDVFHTILALFLLSIASMQNALCIRIDVYANIQINLLRVVLSTNQANSTDTHVVRYAHQQRSPLIGFNCAFIRRKKNMFNI